MTTRTIDVTGGEIEYVTAEVTEITGASLESVTFQVRLVAPTSATEWKAADRVTFPKSSEARVSMLVDDSISPAPNYRLHVRVSDNPEVIDLKLDGPSERITVS